KGTNDANETLYARVSLDTAASNIEGVRLAAGATGTITTLANGKYEVLYSDLNRLAFDFKPFFNDSVTLTIEGISKQDASYALATRTAEITISLTPVADTVSGVAAVAQSSGSANATINEGGAPTLSLVGTPVDAKELVRFEILVGGNSAAASAIKSLSGTTVQTFDAAKAASFGLSASEVGNWKLFSALGTKVGATYTVSNASMDLDKYFDGAISYKTRAVAIEPTTGQEGSASAVVNGTSAGTFTITPTVADNTYAVQIRDLTGNAIRSITLDEGGASSYFTLAGTTFDPDESIAVALANTTYFTVQSQLVDNVTQYRLVHNSASGVPTQVADLTLTPTVTLTDSGVSATYTASATPLSVAVNEIATTPLLSSTTPVAVAINDGQAGLKFSLPTRTNAGDDALLYRVEGVPAWLTPSAGTLISTSGSGAAARSVYQFDSTVNLENLSWSATRSYAASDTPVTLSWKAIHVETSNMRTAESVSVPITFTLKPVAAAPEIIGPASFAIDEGGFVALNQYSIRVPGFETSVINSSVSATVTLGAGAKLEFIRANTTVSATGTVTGLTPTELASAKVLAINPDYYSDTTNPAQPPLTFSISAT
ncbi:MAG: hypothetical protein EBX99_12560, partial [Acidimicrobiia bacterium]|nr:hypothetical protein [Acidimicrobiia bacterium]